MLKTYVTVANGGGTVKAIDYSLERWAALSRYANDGRLPIDNNLAENTIRPIALGFRRIRARQQTRSGDSDFAVYGETQLA